MSIPILNTNIPIIGAPQVEDYNVSVLLKCRCGQRTLVTGKPGSINQCIHCNVLIAIGSFNTEDNGTLSLRVLFQQIPQTDGT